MRLNLEVRSATEIRPRDDRRAQSPRYKVKVTADGKSYKTKVVLDSLYPSWNEMLTLSVAKDTSSLEIQLIHKRTMRNPEYILGECVVTAADILKQSADTEHATLDLERISKGSKVPMKSGSLIVFASCPTPSEALAAICEQTDTGKEFDTTLAIVGPIDGIVNNQAVGYSVTLMKSLSTKLGGIVDIVDEASKIHPMISLAWNVVSSVYKAVKGQLDRDKEILELLRVMSDIYELTNTVKTMEDLKPPLDSTVKLILEQTVECAMFIQEYYGSGFAGRALKQTFDTTSQEKIHDFVKVLLHLHSCITAGLASKAVLVSYRVLSYVERIDRELTLRKLDPIKLDASQLPRCFPDTRAILLRHIELWAISPKAQKIVPENVLWLYGLAGSGKSTISTTLTDSFRELHRLGGSIFFNRDEPQRSDPSHVVRTIAAQLAEFDPRIGREIANAIERIPSICASPLALQFDELLVKSLAMIDSIGMEGPIVIVLDALDECGNPESREQLLDVLSKQSQNLPPCIRIIITSRPEVDIMDAFEPMPNVYSRDLYRLTDSNESDIATYIHKQLSTVRSKPKNRHFRLPTGWPGEQDEAALVKQAAGLFVWASTACAFIDSFNPRQRLRTILDQEVSSNPMVSLDNLFATALGAAGDWTDEYFLLGFQAVIGAVIVSMEPLTTDTIDCLLELKESSPSIHTVECLGCVLSWGPSPNEPIRTLHPSFVDFLVSKERCKRDEWWVDTVLHHRRLALACLDHMEHPGHLKRNILGITLTKTMDRKGSQLLSSVSYACTFFISHICLITRDFEGVGQRLFVFLQEHFLHWLEAMSIMGKARSTVAQLRQLLSWIKKNPDIPDVESGVLIAFVEDAVHFVQANADLIDTHPLLIYQSALPYAPVNSVLRKTFSQEAALPRVEGSVQDWPPVLQVLTGHSANVVDVAVSRDGSRIASCSHMAGDSCIRIWDAHSGAEVMTPLRVEELAPLSVDIAPNGQHAVVGYQDATVRIWDLNKGVVILVKKIPYAPLYCRVRAVTFSKIGPKFLAAGDVLFTSDTVRNRDCNAASNQCQWVIAVWNRDTHDEEIVLRGYAAGITSAVFTKDGTRVVSGSSDSSVIVWDAASGNILAKFTISGSSQSPGELIRIKVAVSPDDQKILVAEQNGRIHLLDIATLGPEEHPVADEAILPIVKPNLSNRANSRTPILFSPTPSSTAFFSAYGAAIRMWDTTSMSIVSEYHGHAHWVTALCCTLDTNRLISGSKDGNIYIWDTTSKHTLQDATSSPLEREFCMHLLRISLDKKYIIYVPDFTSICVRGIYDDRHITYGGHHQEAPEHIITSLAFSPDGCTVASASSDNIIRIWNMLTGDDCREPLTHPSAGEDLRADDDTRYFLAVAFLEVADLLVSGSHRTVVIWDLDTGDKCSVIRRDGDILHGTLLSASGLIHFDRPGSNGMPWNEAWEHECLQSQIEFAIWPLSQSPLLLDRHGWLIEDSSGQVLSKIPSWLSVKQWVASEDTLVFTTFQGDLCMMRFTRRVPNWHSPQTADIHDPSPVDTMIPDDLDLTTWVTSDFVLEPI